MHNSSASNLRASVFENALKNAPDAIAILKAIQDKEDKVIDFEYLFLNKAGELFVDRKDLVGKRMLSTYPQHLENGLFNLYKKVFLTRKSEVADFYYNSHNCLWANISVTPMEEGVTVSCVDITGKKIKKKL